MFSSAQRCASEMNTRYRALSSAQDFALAMGAFGPGNECFSGKWIPILAGLRASPVIPAEQREHALHFFDIHSPGSDMDSVEDEHGNLMLFVLAAYVERQAEAAASTLSRIEHGAREAIAARLSFFDGLDQVL